MSDFFSTWFSSKNHYLLLSFLPHLGRPNVEQTLVFTIRNSLFHLSKKSSFWHHFWWPKVGSGPQKTLFFDSHFSTHFDKLKTENIKSVWYIQCLVRVRNLHFFIIFNNFHVFSISHFLSSPRPLFAHFARYWITQNRPLTFKNDALA